MFFNNSLCVQMVDYSYDVHKLLKESLVCNKMMKSVDISLRMFIREFSWTIKRVEKLNYIQIQCRL